MKSRATRVRAWAAALLGAMGISAHGEVTAPSEADQQCLACHAQAGLTKAFAGGEPLSLHVEADAFAASVHAPLGCAACHAEIDVRKHPGPSKPYESSRAYSTAGMQTCRSCHATIFDAHAGSIHGAARGAGPICADCHSAHAVRRASVGTHLRDACASCHANALESHARWLPNTKRHLDSVACAACHAPGAEKRLDLRLYTVAGGEPRTAAEPGTDKTLDAHGLRQLLESVNRGAAERATFVGRLEARTPEDSHRLAPKGEALRECAACHRKGADPFTNVTLSIVGSDGKRVRYQAASDVLHGAATIDTMRGFYAPGGTRVQALDVLLMLAVGGGILAPIGHLVMRRLLRRKDRQP